MSAHRIAPHHIALLGNAVQEEERKEKERKKVKRRDMGPPP